MAYAWEVRKGMEPDPILEPDYGRIEEKPIPEKDQICTCGHSLARHRDMPGLKHGNSSGVVCVEQFCKCVSFKLYRAK